MHYAPLIHFLFVFLKRAQWNNGLNKDLGCYSQPIFYVSVRKSTSRQWLPKMCSWEALYRARRTGTHQFFFSLKRPLICLFIFSFVTKRSLWGAYDHTVATLINLLVNQVTSQEWGLCGETLTMRIRPLCHLCCAANLNQAWRAHPPKYPTFFSSRLCCCCKCRESHSSSKKALNKKPFVN